jgi:hypothetical protein
MQTIKGTSVQLMVERPYADKVKDANGVERESKMKGKSYWLCTSELGRFTVESGSAIHKAIDSGELWDITLDKNDNGKWEYITHTNINAVVKRAQAERTLEEIRNFVPKGVSLEDALA